MKSYTYNMPPDIARHFAKLPTGGEMTLVVVFKRQPPEGSTILYVDDKVYFEYPYGEIVGYTLPYPLGARIGMREAWLSFGAPFVRRSSQTMPKSGWQWATAVDVKVKQVHDMTAQELYDIFGFLFIDEFIKWLNRRFPGSWERNDWCEVTTAKKE